MLKKYTLRETLDISEASELVSHVLREPVTEKDLLGYCRDQRLGAYINIPPTPVRSLEPVEYAPYYATHEFSAFGLQRIVYPQLIGKPGVLKFSFNGAAVATPSPEKHEKQPGDDTTTAPDQAEKLPLPLHDAEPLYTVIDWEMERIIKEADILLLRQELMALAEELSDSAEMDLDKRAEKGVGQTLAALVLIARQRPIDFNGDAPFSEALKLHKTKQIEFTIQSDTFRKYFRLAGDYMIAGAANPPKTKPRR